MYARACVQACVRAYKRACVCVCACVCMCARMRRCARTCGIATSSSSTKSLTPLGRLLQLRSMKSLAPSRRYSTLFTNWQAGGGGDGMPCHAHTHKDTHEHTWAPYTAAQHYPKTALQPTPLVPPPSPTLTLSTPPHLAVEQLWVLLSHEVDVECHASIPTHS